MYLRPLPFFRPFTHFPFISLPAPIFPLCLPPALNWGHFTLKTSYGARGNSISSQKVYLSERFDVVRM